ncbi:uncharacterized protein LOC100211314 [Hydra vulgaris]|uniref:uncharacterized protein LOC100211314 n=1 Tax=Hydra vulgaris TaxID=6087 RepID=UPI001F5F3BAA|nr:uncharacterized protein LOC100211314 [Hydra vulgaris]
MVIKFAIITLLIISLFVKVAASNKLVVFWGQNNGGAEYELEKYCESDAFDLIILEYVSYFFSTLNNDNYPEVNFTIHCDGPSSPNYPIKCPSIEKGIKLCQMRKKQVLISLLGSSGKTITSYQQGKILAQRIWEMFLGGNANLGPRPFGVAILDGVNLDIKGGMGIGYPEFVNQIRYLMNSDASRNYIISASPQCIFPDVLMHSTFLLQGHKINEVYIQYYNAYCYIGSPFFERNTYKWFDLAANIEERYPGQSPALFVGLIASKRKQHYQEIEKVASIYDRLKTFPNFGGFMLYDAGLDGQNIIGGIKYSDHIKKILHSGYSPPVSIAANIVHVVQEINNVVEMPKPTQTTPAVTNPTKTEEIVKVTEVPLTTISTTAETTTTEATTTDTTTTDMTTTETTTEALLTEIPTTETTTTEAITSTSTMTTASTTTQSTTTVLSNLLAVKSQKTSQTEERKYKVVVNWGQNLVSRSTEQKELSLRTYCERRAYDIIIINQLDIFFDEKNLGDLPALDFSRHCNGRFPGIYPTYLKCDEIALDIEACQAAGKKILLSLGGGIHWNGFVNLEQAKLFAHNIWNLFLGGQYKIRTFGSVVLDGINLNFRIGSGAWFTEFVTELRNLMAFDTSHVYMITSSPGCSFPNYRLGKTFEEVGEMFDALFVKFADNRCYYGTDGFKTLLQKWLMLKPVIYIGLPSSPQSSYDKVHFVPPKEVEKLFEEYIVKNVKVTGIFLDDVSWDDLNLIDERRYSDYVGELLRPYVYQGVMTTMPSKNEAPKVAVNWGQSLANRATRYQEGSLRSYCQRKAYDIFIINTLDVFFDQQNQDGLPSLNLGLHCNGKFPGNYPTYLKCDEIEEDIKFCQEKNKKVLLSLGGGSRWNYFYDSNQAKKFATTLWNLFLGGSYTIRAFGSAILDGINIDFRYGEGFWFNEFIIELRRLMDSDNRHSYMITSSPECIYPSWRLGKTFIEVGDKFDAFFVKFTDNDCFFDNEKGFKDSLEKWLSLKPVVYIGLPSSPQASYNRLHFVTPKRLETLFSDFVQKYDKIGGILLDDASWDDVNMVAGRRYSDYVGELLRPLVYTTPSLSTTPAPQPPKKDKANEIVLSWMVLWLTTSLLLFYNVLQWGFYLFLI